MPCIFRQSRLSANRGRQRISRRGSYPATKVSVEMW